MILKPLIAGVPITRPVGGVACGLITSSVAEDPDKHDIEQYRLLTDILVRTLFSLQRFSIAHLHDDVTRAKSSGSCSH